MADSIEISVSASCEGPSFGKRQQSNLVFGAPEEGIVEVTPEVQKALELIYLGQTNVAVKAQEVGLTLEAMKDLFSQYVKNRELSE